MNPRYFAIFILTALLLSAGCSRLPSAGPLPLVSAQSGKDVKTPAPAPGNENPPAPATAPAPASPLKPENFPDVVAEVNGQTIKKTDLLEHLQMAEVQMQSIGPIPPERRSEFIKAVLDDMIGRKLLVQDAQAKKIEPSKEQMDKQLGEMKKQFPDAAAFAKALKDEGLTEEKLRDRIQEQLTFNKYVETVVVPKVVINDAEAQKFYDSNKDKMHQPEQVKASHILIRVDPKADEKTKKEARAKADDLLKRAKANEDFAALAKQYSEDPGSKENGGNLDFFTKDQMVPEFTQAAWALKPNEISSVVETSFGLHIIKVTERKPEQVIPFDTAKERIKDFLKQKGISENLRTVVSGLREKAKVKVLI